jgi:hypothetical protein
MTKSTEKKFWQYFAYGYLVINTVCLIMIFETIVLGKPYVSLFLLIFAALSYLNFKSFGKGKAKASS